MAMNTAGRSGQYFDDLETMRSEVREQYLNQRLSQVVSHAYYHAPSAREILEKAGIVPSQISTIRDLEKVPIIRKPDLIEWQRRRPPYGGFLAVPPEDVERIFISPGPIYEPLHSSRIKWFARAFYAAGFRKGDIVVNTFSYHMSPAGILFHEALRDCGATVVVIGTGNTEIQLQTMLDLRVTGFVGTPTFLMTVIKKAEEMGHDFRHDFALERAWFTGEMLPLSLRKTLETDYRITTSQAYAVTEPGGAIAYECPQQSGMHFMDDYVIEIVDPETGKQLGPGEVGEIVVTPVHNIAWGLVRFGTGDMSSYTTEPCPCGRTAPRLGALVGRTSDAIKVRGMFVVARQAEQVVLSFEPVSRFQIVVKRQQQRDEMGLRVELKDEAADREQLAAELGEKFQNLCRLKLDRIDFVARGVIPEKHQTIVDERTWK
ncbi:MAG: AMP-binding protein [Dehalococcoidales bacterium]|nr:AMP-binding protein [Dehalococcoidales bacterium]